MLEEQLHILLIEIVGMCLSQLTATAFSLKGMEAMIAAPKTSSKGLDCMSCTIE